MHTRHATKDSEVHTSGSTSPPSASSSAPFAATPPTAARLASKRRPHCWAQLSTALPHHRRWRQASHAVHVVDEDEEVGCHDCVLLRQLVRVVFPQVLALARLVLRHSSDRCVQDDHVEEARGFDVVAVSASGFGLVVPLPAKESAKACHAQGRKHSGSLFCHKMRQQMRQCTQMRQQMRQCTQNETANETGHTTSSLLLPPATR